MTLKRGHDLPERKRVEGPVPVVSSSGITGCHNEAIVHPPGVVTGRYGTIGEVFFIEEPYWPHNTALYVIDFKGNSPRYVAYLLRNTLRNYKTEKAAVPGVDRNVLHTLKVRVPDPDDQADIVSILSAYDDLIQNNRRRIALLEEAARLLYRQWFVNFRFPGHDHVKLRTACPRGGSDVRSTMFARPLEAELRRPRSWSTGMVAHSLVHANGHHAKLLPCPTRQCYQNHGGRTPWVLNKNASTWGDSDDQPGIDWLLRAH